jgi:hypothetical protein
LKFRINFISLQKNTGKIDGLFRKGYFYVFRQNCGNAFVFVGDFVLDSQVGWLYHYEIGMRVLTCLPLSIKDNYS